MSVDLLKREIILDVQHEQAQPALRTTVFGELAAWITRLARNSREIEAAQAIRYRVFVEEMGASLLEEPMRLKARFRSFTMIFAITCWWSIRR